jgi:hypothetical protein
VEIFEVKRAGSLKQTGYVELNISVDRHSSLLASYESVGESSG